MPLRYGVLAVRNNGFLNLEIEGDSKIVIDYCNRKSNSSSSIILLMRDLRRFYYEYFNYYHIYLEANRIIYTN